MKIELYERVFLLLGIALLIAGLAAIGISVVSAGVHVPSPGGRVDPQTLRQTPPFDEPGVRQTGDNEYEVVMIGQIWSWTPNEIRVPAGSEVTFRVSSPDVIHGLLIENTQVNIMIIPGQISEVTQTFEEPGEYLMICHEYCGTGHHTMFGRVVVE